MKSLDFPMLVYIHETEMDERELSETLQWKRHQTEAARLNGLGIHTRLTTGDGQKFPYVLVYPPDGKLPATYATPQECRHLADIAANMQDHLQEAYDRWLPSVEGFETMSEEEVRRLELENDASDRRWNAEYPWKEK